MHPCHTKKSQYHHDRHFFSTNAAMTWKFFQLSPDSSIGDLVTNSLTKYQTLLKNTTLQHSEKLVTLETCDKSDEETGPDQQKHNYKYKDNDNDKDNDKYIQRRPSKSDPRDL